MTHALPAHFSDGNLNTTFFADNTAMFQAFVFTTQTFVIFDRAKDFAAEQTFTFRFKSTVVDGFRLFDFTE